MEERKSSLAFEKEAIKRAESVLVVGGGAVGVEVMGELVHHYSQKEKDGKVTLKKRFGLVTRSHTLLSYFHPKA